MEAAETIDGIRRGIKALQEAKEVAAKKAHEFQPQLQEILHD